MKLKNYDLSWDFFFFLVLICPLCYDRCMYVCDLTCQSKNVQSYIRTPLFF